MSWKRWALIGVLAVCAMLVTALPGAWAQDYRFSLDRNISHVIVNRDGSADIEYWLTYTCDSGAHPIDIIDVGLPKRGYNLSSAQAWFSPGAGDMVTRSMLRRPRMSMASSFIARLPPSASGAASSWRTCARRSAGS